MSAVVVRLPTAAPRKVRQHYNKQAREARNALPQFPRARCLWPDQRRRVEEVRPMLDGEPGLAALRLSVAMFRHLDQRQQGLVKMHLAVAAFSANGTSSAKAALAFAKFESAERDEQDGLAWALDKLATGEWE